MEWRRREDVVRLLDGLKRIGYPESENLQIDNLDQLYMTRSSGMVLEAVSELINDPSFPSAHQLHLYEELVDGGYLDFEDEPEDNGDLLELLKEEEQSQLQELDNDELQPKEQYESELPRVLEEWMESVKSFLAQLDRLKTSLMPSDGAADFSISTIYYRIHEIAGMIGDLSKEHVQRVTGCVRTDELPGSQFELIPTEMVLLNPLPGETVAIYEGMAKEILRKMGIDPATSFSDQQWIDWERNQFIANELDHLQRFGLEKLAITQSLLALTREFTGALESLGSSCESLKGKVSRLRRDRLESPLRMPDEPVIANNIEVTDHMLIETGNLSNLITDNISQLQPVLTTKSILAPALYGAEVSLRTQIQETSQWLQSCQSLLPMSREESQMRKLLASATQTRINL